MRISGQTVANCNCYASQTRVFNNSLYFVTNKCKKMSEFGGLECSWSDLTKHPICPHGKILLFCVRTSERITQSLERFSISKLFSSHLLFRSNFVVWKKHSRGIEAILRMFSVPRPKALSFLRRKRWKIHRSTEKSLESRGKESYAFLQSPKTFPSVQRGYGADS